MSGIDLTKYQSKAPQESGQHAAGGVMDFMNRDINLFGNQLSDKKKERFYAELQILLSSGLDLKSALELMEEEQESSSDQKLMKQIRESVIHGSSLSEVMEASGRFSPYEFHSIAIGEETAKLNRVLAELNDYFSKKITQRRQITSALAYPAIVIATAFFAIFFMMNFIVPLFADVFTRFGSDLPALTKAVLAMSESVKSNVWYLVVAITITTVVSISQRKKTWYRKLTSHALLKLPIVGTLMRKIFLARFCQSMALLISAKIPLLQAIRLVKKMIVFYPIESTLSEVEADILQGNALHESLSRFPIFNKRMVSLIKVGGEVNQLETMFDKLAAQYTQEVEHQTGMLGSMLEPLLIIFLGVVVGIILVAMYLPMFQLSMQFG